MNPVPPKHMTLTQLHKKALKEHWAVPHFNFSTLEQLNGILDATTEMRAPVVFGATEAESKFVGRAAAVALVRSFREEYSMPIFLNADHHKSSEAAIEAFDAGYDSVHIDLSKKSYKENVEGTRRVVDYVKSKNHDVEVEGELGYFATESSQVYKEEIEIPEDSYTNVEQAVKYVEETGIDRFAPAVGTLHGIAANTPRLRFDLVKGLRASLPGHITLVLHGGSGVTEEEMRRVVEMGFNNIHVSTELRLANIEALRKVLEENPDEIKPYNYLQEPRKAVAEVVKEKLKIFQAINVL